jgi:hypothetical protein
MKKIILTTAFLAMAASATERYMLSMISMHDGYPKYHPYGKVYASFESCDLVAERRRAEVKNDYITFQCFEVEIFKAIIAGAGK